MVSSRIVIRNLFPEHERWTNFLSGIYKTMYSKILRGEFNAILTGSGYKLKIYLDGIPKNQLKNSKNAQSLLPSLDKIQPLFFPDIYFS